MLPQLLPGQRNALVPKLSGPLRLCLNKVGRPEGSQAGQRKGNNDPVTLPDTEVEGLCEDAPRYEGDSHKARDRRDDRGHRPGIPRQPQPNLAVSS